MLKCLFLCSIFSTLICVNFSVLLPSNFRKCDRKSKNFGNCLGKATEEVLGLLHEPIPELGLPSLDPISLSNATFPPGSVHFLIEQKLWNLELSGFMNAKVVNFTIDFKSHNIVFESLFPQVKGEMNYDFDGILFGEKIKSKGLLSFTLKNVLNHMTATFEEYEKNGRKHMTVEGKHNTFSSDNLDFFITSENKTIGEHLTKVYQQNYDVVRKDIENAHNLFYLQFFVHTFNNVLTVVPVSELFGAE